MALGIYEYRQLDVEAFPDISPIMVPVFAEAEGMAPEEVEQAAGPEAEEAVEEPSETAATEGDDS